MAIGLVMIGLVGVISLMVQNLHVQHVDNNNLIASTLAQEGIELVRNQRDRNWLTGGAEWFEYIAGTDGTFAIDYYPPFGSEININDSPDSIDDAGARLEIDDYGYYAHNIGGADTKFYRLIEIDDSTIGGADLTDDHLAVTVTVRYRERERVHDYIVKTKLYPWRY